MNLQNDDNHSQKKLDLEFRRILLIIKPHIPCIMNKDYLALYQMWLEKLSKVDSQEKEERNRYLVELCHQIQDGVLEKPFTQLPPAGPLPPFRDDLQNTKVQEQQHVFRQLTSVKEVSCQNTILKDVDCNYKPDMSQKKTENEINEVPEDCVNNVPEINQIVVKDTSNLEILPTVHKNRNRRTIFKKQPPSKNSVLHKRVAEDNVELSKSPKQVYPLQFESQSNFFQDEVVIGGLQPFFTNSKQCDFTNKCYSHKQEPESVQEELSKDVASLTQELRKIKPQQQNFINMSVTCNKENGNDDSSWCDLTDISCSTTVTKIDSGDSDVPTMFLNCTEPCNNDSQNYLYEMYDARISDLMNIITELQKQNLSLNEDVAKYERDLSLRNVKAVTSIHNLADEVKSLKSRLQELTEIKNALKNSHFVASSQWQSTINALNKELFITQNQNSALKAEIAELKIKLELSSQQQKEDASLRRKLRDIHDKEIEMLKQNQVKHIAGVEKKFSQILSEKENAFNQKRSDLKDFYERKISDINSEYEKTLKNRNVEIKRLETTIENQCKRTHEEVRGIRNQMEENANVSNDNNVEKIAFLQKCLWRMNHLFRKTEKKYNKQIFKLKHEIEMKDKAIQIQMTTQRAALVATTNTKRQVETDTTVVLLEERYRKLLENQQAHFLSEKQNDAKLISQLRAMITNNNNNINTK